MKDLEFGTVLITKGKYKGCVGNYDDESDYPSKGVVYLNTPFLDPYVLIPYKNMVNTDMIHLPTENLKKAHPQFCEQMGLA